MTKTETTIMFVGAREVREIPKGWRHPKDTQGRWVPLLPFGYLVEEGEPEYPTMPEPRGETEIVAYESTTEGTPISPAFPNTPEGRLALVNYCSDHCTTFGSHTAGADGIPMVEPPLSVGRPSFAQPRPRKPSVQ